MLQFGIKANDSVFDTLSYTNLLPLYAYIHLPPLLCHTIAHPQLKSHLPHLALPNYSTHLPSLRLHLPHPHLRLPLSQFLQTNVRSFFSNNHLYSAPFSNEKQSMPKSSTSLKLPSSFLFTSLLLIATADRRRLQLCLR